MATFIGTLFGVWGVFFALCGLLVPLLLPLVPAATGHGYRLSTLHLWLAMKLHGRMAWVVDPKDRLVPKQLHRDGATGDEYVSMDGERHTFEDRDLALSKWMNVDMTLADGKYGVLFDPRHAALAGRIMTLREQDAAVVPAGSERAHEVGVGQWIRGVIGFPRDRFEVPRLAWVRQLFGGRERATHPDVLQEFYRKSREPYRDDGGDWARLLTVIGAVILPALAMWLVGDYIGGGGSGVTGGGGSGGGAGNDTDTELGFVLMLLSLASIRAIPWRAYLRRAVPIIIRVTAWMATIGALIGAHYVTASAYGIGAMLAVDVAFLAGLGVFGLLLLLGAATRIIGGGVSGLLFKLGLLAYRRPVWVWTRSGYSLIDWARIDDDRTADHSEPVWYRAFGSDVGFSFEPTAASWPEHIDTASLRVMGGGGSRGDATSRPDGGVAGGAITDTNLPTGHVGVPDMRRGGGYGGYVPREPDDEQYYVNSGVALNRLWDAATGDKSLNALLAAKEEYGGDGSLGEGIWLLVTAGLALVSFVAGAGLFVI